MPDPALPADPLRDRACIHARLIDAAPAQVFRAFAAPEHLARWWGPQGFRSTFDCFEFRPGGRWQFMLHGPDGTDYPNACLFRTIEPPHRLVIEHLGGFHHFLLTVRLEPHAGGTRVHWHQLFDTAEHRDAVAAFVQPANEQNLDRLAAQVRAMQGA